MKKLAGAILAVASFARFVAQAQLAVKETAAFGNFGYTAALNNPDLVKALIAIEPSGAPNPQKTDLSKIKGVPHLVVFGDFLDKQALWTRLIGGQQKYAEALRSADFLLIGWIFRKWAFAATRTC